MTQIKFSFFDKTYVCLFSYPLDLLLHLTA